MKQKINMYITAFHILHPSKKASAAVLADPFNSLSILDLYLAHTLHHIFTTNCVPSSSIIFLSSTLSSLPTSSKLLM